MYKDITEYFTDLIEQSGSYDIANVEFRHHLEDDPALQDDYKEWCEVNGYHLKNGFERFCQDHFENGNEKWDTLNDFDE